MNVQVVFNRTASPLVIDDEGRTVPGLGWAKTDIELPCVVEHLDAHRVTVIDRLAEGKVDPDAQAAFSATYAGETDDAPVEPAKPAEQVALPQSTPDTPDPQEA